MKLEGVPTDVYWLQEQFGRWRANKGATGNRFPRSFGKPPPNSAEPTASVPWRLLAKHSFQMCQPRKLFRCVSCCKKNLVEAEPMNF